MSSSQPSERVLPLDPAHVNALAALPVLADKIRYAAEHAPAPRTAVVRDWLDAYGVKTRRPYASSLVNAWCRVRGLADTGEQPSLTDDLLAELDAAAEATRRVPDVETAAPMPVLDASFDGDELGSPTPTLRVGAALGQPVIPQPRKPVTTEVLVPSLPSGFGAGRVLRTLAGALLTLAGVLLTAVIVAPIALSSQDIIAWAGSSTGLGLEGPWPVLTFAALDAAAAVCVCIVVYCAWRGESAGVFAWLVWVFAGTSAFANYRHGTVEGAAPDAWWFFPAMSLAGPFLLEVTVRRVRKWVQEGTGQRARHGVSFGFARWVPGVGATRETYGAWRLARLNGIDDADRAISEYRRLCPDGSVRVLRALRGRVPNAS